MPRLKKAKTKEVLTKTLGQNELDSKNKTSEDGAIDDPVRMYLMQMGRIPLLTRDEEVSAAIAIDKARFKFRNKMLATDFMLRGAYQALKLVLRKKLRLDRTIEVSVTNKQEKERIMLRLVPNLKTLKHLLALNHTDYVTSVCNRFSNNSKRSTNVCSTCVS